MSADAPQLVLLARQLQRELHLVARQCAQVRSGAAALRARELAARAVLEVYARTLPEPAAEALRELLAAPTAGDLAAWALAGERLGAQALDRARELALEAGRAVRGAHPGARA